MNDPIVINCNILINKCNLGAYGGRGGPIAGKYLSVDESLAYGSLATPALGSGGGGSCGGRGGGMVKIDVTSTAEVLGLISVNGDGATGINCGGGSGGGIFLRASHFKGSGLLASRGGIGSSGGGSGGGGRIAVNHTTSIWTGDIVADGGISGIDIFFF